MADCYGGGALLHLSGSMDHAELYTLERSFGGI